jgi:hypothetical protein
MNSLDAVIIDSVGSANQRTREWLHGQGYFDVKSFDCTLMNTVHPVFHHDRFLDLSNTAYENMKPALQLATKWIENDRMLSWFWHLMQAEVTVKRGVKPFLAVLPNRDISMEEKKTKWQKILREFSTFLTWRMKPTTPSNCGNWGLTFPFKESRDQFAELDRLAGVLDRSSHQEMASGAYSKNPGSLTSTTTTPTTKKSLNQLFFCTNVSATTSMVVYPTRIHSA